MQLAVGSRRFTRWQHLEKTVGPLTHRAPMPWWVAPLAVYVALRVINAVMIVVASRHAVPVTTLPDLQGNHIYAALPPQSYLTTITNWDGQWYWEIAANGYPKELPTDNEGHVGMNAWAFFPLYPLTVRLVAFLTSASFPLAASALSATCGALATLFIYKLVTVKADRLGGILATTSISSFACAPVFLLAYAEGLALALLSATLLAFHHRRYATTAILILLLSLTRGVVLPLGFFFAACALLSWRNHGRLNARPLQTLALAAWSGSLSFLWPAIAAVITGRSDAYVKTQAAWNPEITTLPLIRFFQRYSEEGRPIWLLLFVAMLLVVIVIGPLVIGQRDLQLGVWTCVYSLYVFAVVDWNPTALRYFLLAIPALWPLAHSQNWQSLWRRLAAATIFTLVGLMTQWWWIRYSVTITPELIQLP